MELPRRILVGYGVIEQLGSFLLNLGFSDDILIVSGPNVMQKIGEHVASILKDEDFKAAFFKVESADVETVKIVESEAVRRKVNLILGLGGGKSVDVAKLSAFNAKLPFVSIPTSASHDGISSPFASIKGLNRPYSFVAKPPAGILADIDIIAEAPRRLLASGCGDLLAKLTAVSDWKLAREVKGEYFGKYASSLALLSAEMVISESRSIGEGDKESVRDVVEALMSAGVAAGIAGSSRPCSGAEHLFSHALDLIAPGMGLHGEKCGLGAILMAKLHNLDSEKIASALRNVNAPVNAVEIGLKPKDVIDALLLAPSIRPERHTILNEMKLNEESALDLARSVGVL